MSWGPYDKYLTKLFGHMHREPPPGFNRISVSQLIEADRKVFSRLIELDVKPRKASDGTFPMDDALMQALESYEVSFSLMHLQSRAAPPPNRPNKRQREEDTRKGKGKSKWSQPKGKGKNKSSPPWMAIPKVIRDKGGVAQLPSGEALCFDFNIHGDGAKCKAGSTCVPNALDSTL